MTAFNDCKGPVPATSNGQLIRSLCPYDLLITEVKCKLEVDRARRLVKSGALNRFRREVALHPVKLLSELAKLTRVRASQAWSPVH